MTIYDIPPQFINHAASIIEIYQRSGMEPKQIIDHIMVRAYTTGSFKAEQVPVERWDGK